MGLARSTSIQKDTREPQNDGSSQNTRLSSLCWHWSARRERGPFFLTLCAGPVQPLRTWFRRFWARLRLFMGSLSFRALFGCQHRECLVPGLEPRHPQCHSQYFALFHFGFDFGQVGLLLPLHQRLHFPFVHMDLRFESDPCTIEVEFNGFQLFYLFLRQPELLLVFQEMPKVVGLLGMVPSHLPIFPIRASLWIRQTRLHTQSQQGDHAYHAHCENIGLHRVLLG